MLLRQLQTFFPDSLPASCGALTPSGRVHAPTPVLSLRSDRSLSLSSQHRPPRRVSRQASRAGECYSAPSLCAGVSPLCPPHPCGCALLRGSEAPTSATRNLCPRRGFLVRGNLSSFTAPSHWCRCRPYSFVSVVSFFLLPYPNTWGFSCLLGGLTFYASVQWVFCRSSSTCRCISTVSVGRKVISASYSSTIFSTHPQACVFWLEYLIHSLLR